MRDKTKQEHFLTFMSNILEKGFAEEVPPLPDTEECWYLPIVYHPKKLTGPNLTNDLLGILIRFRQGPVAVTVNIQKMFYGFYVQPDHRKFLRFFGIEGMI